MKKKPKTCLNNHKGYISHPIIPIVINSFRGGHTQTHILTLWTKAISRNQSHTGQRTVYTWFKNSKDGRIIQYIRIN